MAESLLSSVQMVMAVWWQHLLLWMQDSHMSVTLPLHSHVSTVGGPAPARNPQLTG